MRGKNNEKYEGKNKTGSGIYDTDYTYDTKCGTW